jgi:hypothetical protein
MSACLSLSVSVCVCVSVCGEAGGRMGGGGGRHSCKTGLISNLRNELGWLDYLLRVVGSHNHRAACIWTGTAKMVFLHATCRCKICQLLIHSMLSFYDVASPILDVASPNLVKREPTDVASPNLCTLTCPPVHGCPCPNAWLMCKRNIFYHQAIPTVH